jgi:hypothetical protein
VAKWGLTNIHHLSAECLYVLQCKCSGTFLHKNSQEYLLYHILLKSVRTYATSVRNRCNYATYVRHMEMQIKGRSLRFADCMHKSGVRNACKYVYESMYI